MGYLIKPIHMSKETQENMRRQAIEASLEKMREAQKGERKVCPICKGNGTVPTKCPRCFGSGKEEPAHTLFWLRFRDNVELMTLDNPRNLGIRVMPGESITLDNIYIEKNVVRELKCTSVWYISRWRSKGRAINENTGR